MSVVLVHGGGCTARCWGRMVPFLREPPLAVDLPGRRARPGDLASLGIGDFVDAVVDDIEAAGLDDVLLVGHSLAGVVLPGVAARVPDRLRGLVFVSCTVPADGTRVIDTLEPEVRDLAEANRELGGGPMDPDMAVRLFCNDLDEEQCKFVLSDLVPEAPGVIFEPVSLEGLRAPIPRTFVRLSRDAIVEPWKQDVMIRNMGGADVVELDAGHMAMVGRPEELAAVLEGLDRTP